MNELNKSPKFPNLGKVATTRGGEGAATAIPPIALGGTKPIAQKHLSPQRMLAVLVAGIFLSEVVEMLIMYGFRRVRPLPEWVDFGLDSLIMVVVAFPLIYYYAFHALLSHIEQRKRSETLLIKVLESLPVGVFITDQNGAILHGNRASQEIWSSTRYVGKEQYGEYKAWWPESGQAVAPEEWASPRVLVSGQTILDEEWRSSALTVYTRPFSTLPCPSWKMGSSRAALWSTETSPVASSSSLHWRSRTEICRNCGRPRAGNASLRRR